MTAFAIVKGAILPEGAKRGPKPGIVSSGVANAIREARKLIGSGSTKINASRIMVDRYRLPIQAETLARMLEKNFSVGPDRAR